MNKPKLSIKIETTDKIIKMNCTRCFGTGMIKREMLFSNYKYKKNNKKICIECIKCLGSGEIRNEKIENNLKPKYIDVSCRNSI